LYVQAREAEADATIRRAQQMEQRSEEKITEANDRVKLAESQVLCCCVSNSS
jgi:hypothetical protein